MSKYLHSITYKGLHLYTEMCYTTLEKDYIIHTCKSGRSAAKITTGAGLVWFYYLKSSYFDFVELVVPPFGVTNSAKPNEQWFQAMICSSIRII